jgi:hypothetical protein
MARKNGEPELVSLWRICRLVDDELQDELAEVLDSLGPRGRDVWESLFEAEALEPEPAMSPDMWSDAESEPVLRDVPVR